MFYAYKAIQMYSSRPLRTWQFQHLASWPSRQKEISCKVKRKQEHTHTYTHTHTQTHTHTHTDDFHCVLTRKANIQMTHTQVQNWKILCQLRVSLILTSHTMHTCMYVRTIPRLNHCGQDSKIQFTVYDSQTPVTLKQSQGHQTYYE